MISSQNRFFFFFNSLFFLNQHGFIAGLIVNWQIILGISHFGMQYWKWMRNRLSLRLAVCLFSCTATLVLHLVSTVTPEYVFLLNRHLRPYCVLPAKLHTYKSSSNHFFYNFPLVSYNQVLLLPFLPSTWCFHL